MNSLSEELSLFSRNGVPLRSKLTIQIKEQDTAVRGAEDRARRQRRHGSERCGRAGQERQWPRQCRRRPDQRGRQRPRRRDRRRLPRPQRLGARSVARRSATRSMRSAEGIELSAGVSIGFDAASRRSRGRRRRSRHSQPGSTRRRRRRLGLGGDPRAPLDPGLRTRGCRRRDRRRRTALAATRRSPPRARRNAASLPRPRHAGGHDRPGDPVGRRGRRATLRQRWCTNAAGARRRARPAAAACRPTIDHVRAQRATTRTRRGAGRGAGRLRRHRSDGERRIAGRRSAVGTGRLVVRDLWRPPPAAAAAVVVAVSSCGCGGRRSPSTRARHVGGAAGGPRH